VSSPPACTVRVARPLGLALDPTGVLEALRASHAPWLLESASTSRVGRFSFVGADPYLVLRARAASVEVEVRRTVYEGLTPGTMRRSAPLLETLRALLPAPPADGGEAPFCGGAVGALGYEAAEQLDVHHLHGIDDLCLPDAVWLFVDALVAFDHRSGTAEVSGLGFADDESTARRRAEAAADALLAQLSRSPASPRARRDARPSVANAASTRRSTLDLPTYRKAVEETSHQIAAGEVYQACLTYRVDRPFTGDPWRLYRELRRRDPAPFAAYLELPELCIAGSSPERFLRVDAEGRVESRPIKGTAPRGADPDEDARRHAGLAASEKDRAENLMIVDLVRNDLGRVCETGSVAVPELFAVEPYAAVFQLVSTVTGKLRPDCDALDAVAACFPPGSMTGAPKIAAMRLLDRLESVRRGFYAGAIGYLDARGGADLAVVIRTAFLVGGRAYLHAGGGIVADSDAAAEYAESLAKLHSLLAALDACEPEVS
jgi:aminodeoxychorismate synthase component I